ncbi:MULTISPECIES: EthD domain-containing protein [unclassified Rhodococcus (in: high G+C Gram-positive bacteria)]|uniref:EthD domain-containing protein n=1 Tax=unclassified Rhodococcus (in: high G+C Gram-positive bacteria) TaxID=192944 RepID=UPI0007BB3F48|nr:MULTISPECIES: EthD domain-containing protein [unclassified Rhodococcus (in: high G+C Gram-positive bacteria)]KZE98239.1 hypothetical protein A2J02_12890 [Rhodococcus sp. EPR-147]KZF06975.1 hypothetical protein A2J04_03850 [Rhodococcus sp. EPR-279]
MTDFRVVAFIRRADGVSAEDLRVFYEEKLTGIFRRRYPDATRYVRRYLTSFPNPLTQETTPIRHDMMTEAWFASRADFEQAQQRLSSAESVEDRRAIRLLERRFIGSIEVVVVDDVEG